ncbi:hypothetical protein [Kibdelosporangium phytohabitans]|uniref:hypothetical protein n=1 Tax=Kibdelosporangium phytohabitans TaxID=860235 RepID=UPI0012F78E97|nr:hypothetical protein [Kibdelosporangium phytohabitans]MBE1469357.1 hypothetical protein [Kibdelosporangium phytohabitans]
MIRSPDPVEVELLGRYFWSAGYTAMGGHTWRRSARTAPTRTPVRRKTLVFKAKWFA